MTQVILNESTPDRQFLPFWEIDEAVVNSLRDFNELTSMKSMKVKSHLSEYKVIDSSGKEEIVKAECAQEAAKSSSIKNPKAIIYLENVTPSFLDKDFFEA